MVITAPAFTCTKASVKVNAFDLAGLKIYRSWHADGTQNGPWCSKLKSSFIVVRSANGLNWNCMCVNLNMQHLLGAWPQPVQAFLLCANYLKYFALFRYLFASLFVFVCINICMQFWTLIFMPNANALKLKNVLCVNSFHTELNMPLLLQETDTSLFKGNTAILPGKGPKSCLHWILCD